MVDHTEELILTHTETLAEVQARSKSNTKRINELSKLFDVVHELSLTFTRHVAVIEQQSKDLTRMVQTLETHDQKIESLEEKMETKETVSKLYGKVEELQKLIDDKENAEQVKKISEYEDMKKFILKILLGAGVLVIGALVMFAVIVLMTLTKTGALPTP